MKNKRKFVIISFLLLFVVVTGIVGYMILLKVGFIDALYMTIITISTVGYGEVGEMTDGAKLFSIFIILSGLTVFGYGITSLISLFFEGELKDAWRKRRMESKINMLREHYIVCGAGDVGRTVVKCFRDSAVNFVVIEENDKRVEELGQMGILTVSGNATNEDF
ncbi:MAG: TrkA family potassium uptake protein [Velocimicrobium sp.]